MSDAPVPTGSRTNVLAIVALILAIFLPLVGAILGHVAMGQIKKTGEEGRGLALAAIIIGWIFTGFAILGFIAWFVAFATVGMALM